MLNERREPAAVVLARATLPNRNVTLNDVSVYSIPVDWQAFRRVGSELNRLKETPIERFEIQSLKPPTSVHEGLPWAASVVANHYNPEIPVILPSEADIAAMKPWLRDVSGFIGRFSPRLQDRFGRFIEGRAEQIITSSAQNTLTRLDKIAEVDHPRARFVPELAQIYRDIAAPQYVEDDSFDPIGNFFSFFDDSDTPRMVEVPVESTVASLINSLEGTRNGFPSARINRSNYPLVSRALEIANFPPPTLDGNMAGIAGSELLVGIEKFLRRQRVANISSAPEPSKAFDLFDLDTWNGQALVRSAAETFKWDLLMAVKTVLPNILVEVQNVLPESGPAVTQSVRRIAENVLILSKQGVSNSEIAAAMFKK